ncbi:MAG: LacI family transcriptional regulator [Clostridiales bacterium]|nr:LacI family transcriptional regulator [Clostridiales bacterium]
MGITTKDLAQICGVSRTTVHRALSGEGRIHPDTKEMILRVARENDYQPDLLARGLVKGKTSNIGIVVLDVKNRYFAEMLSVIGAETNRRGYCMNIMLHNDDRSLEQKQMLRLAAYHMDGIILSSVNQGEEYREFLKNLDIPIVTVDNRIAEGLPFVSIDQEAAMEDAAQLVFSHGFERVVYVCPLIKDAGKKNISVHLERLDGFKHISKKYQDTDVEYLLDWGYLDRASAILSDGKKTAFLCAADSFALELISHLRTEGKFSPKDYGIMGFDNVDTLKYLQPQLCTVSNSVSDVAIAAAELLFQLIDEKQSGGKEPQKSVERILSHKLIKGETLGFL